MSNPRPVHFEIHADDVDRARQFYAEVFGWQFEDYGQFVGSPYWGVVTGEEGEPGINGGLLARPVPRPSAGQGANAYVVTIGCDDFDAYAERIIANGGEVAMPKVALAGMAWQGYFTDTEGNVFGLHQPDPDAA